MLTKFKEIGDKVSKTMHSIKEKSRCGTICVLLFLSFLSFYTVFRWPQSDQTRHVPIIYQLIDGSLYQRDYYIITESQNYATIFQHIMATISTVDNLFYMYFILAFVLNIIFIFSIFFLAKQILNNTNTALLVTFMFSMYRMSLETVELSVVTVIPRTFVLAFVPLIIYLYLRNIQNYSRIRALIVFLVLGLLYNIHPISALPIIIVTLGTEILYFKRLNGVYFAILIFMLALPTNINYFTVQTASPCGEVLRQIVDIRTPYHTFDYRIKALLGTLIYAPILAVIAYYMKHRDRTKVDKILISWIIFFVFFSFISIFISNFISHKLIFYLLPRVWKYGYLLSIIYAVLLASLLWNKRNFHDTRTMQERGNMNSLRRGIFISKLSKFPFSKLSAILIIFFLIGSTVPLSGDENLTPTSIVRKYAGNSLSIPFTLVFTYDNPLGRIFYDTFHSSNNKYLNWICKRIESSKKIRELREIGEWTKRHTGKDTLIMSYPPDFCRFRVYSQRNVLVTYDDGALGGFSEEVFRKWWYQYNEVKNGDPIEVANKYDVDYILTNSSINLHLEKAYYTKHFNLYRMR